MADIFISYKREDIGLAKALAAKLITFGWTVWWDRYIPVGRAFDQVIEEELKNARCILVLWTQLSVNSLNVKEEALDGLKRKILVPVSIGDVRLPYGFKMIQTLQWADSAEIKEEAFKELTSQIQQLIGNPVVVKEELQVDNFNAVSAGPSQNPPAAKTAAVSNEWKGATLNFTKPNSLAAAIQPMVSFKAIESSTKIFIDGQNVGNIRNNETLTFSVSPGNHHLQVKGGGAFWGTSKNITIGPGENLTLKVGYTVTGGLSLTQD